MFRALRPVLVCLTVAAPAVVLRIAGVHPPAALAMAAFGVAVVAAAFALAWAAEAAEVDISGGLAVAILAVIAVLPEYAVDLFFGHRAGTDPAYAQFAAANMTGSNRLLLGLGWPVVALLSLWLAARRSGRTASVRPTPRAVVLEASSRVELGFLLIASVAAFVMPLTGTIGWPLGCVLLAWFAFYLVRVAGGHHDSDPDLVGPAAPIGALPARVRRPVVVAMFVLAAAVIVVCAEPFAEALVATGGAVGIDRFLLVQWLAPLSSEAPEFIVAILFAVRGRAAAALALLISAKVNQWTLLIGSLPVAHLLGGGDGVLVLDARQVEEVLLTSTQTLLGVGLLLALRFPRWGAIALLGLFAVQFLVPGTTGRLVVSAVYGLLAAVLFVGHRRHLLPTLGAPFRRPVVAGTPDQPSAESPRLAESRA